MFSEAEIEVIKRLLETNKHLYFCGNDKCGQCIDCIKTYIEENK
jgi:hypothetical protein